MSRTLGTVRVRDTYMTSEEVADHLRATTPDSFGRVRTISDRAAVTIASRYASPGAVGQVLAGFATGVRVDANDLRDDTAATMRRHLTLGEDCSELLALLDWTDRKRSGVRILTTTYRVESNDDETWTTDEDTREDFVPARADSSDGYFYASAARVLADAIRREGATFTGGADWATTEPHVIDYADGTEQVVTAHLQHVSDTTEHRVRRMVQL